MNEEKDRKLADQMIGGITQLSRNSMVIALGMLHVPYRDRQVRSELRSSVVGALTEIHGANIKAALEFYQNSTAALAIASGWLDVAEISPRLHADLLPARAWFISLPPDAFEPINEGRTLH